MFKGSKREELTWEKVLQFLSQLEADEHKLRILVASFLNSTVSMLNISHHCNGWVFSAMADAPNLAALFLYKHISVRTFILHCRSSRIILSTQSEKTISNSAQASLISESLKEDERK